MKIMLTILGKGRKILDKKERKKNDQVENIIKAEKIKDFYEYT